ncbi:hypothetical protein [Staphylococcus saccharolyticus]|uniref:hypothetical protein n=1 Tax=Staphylococcus saccharolyticus TaxID=33028 RepID=UPI001EE3BE43|nr:hypothetical protein [Staphylococcus saccharolyticus]
MELVQDKKLEKFFKSKDNFGFLIDTENFDGKDEGDPLYVLNEDKIMRLNLMGNQLQSIKII